jgi:hypothetical protein
MQGKAGVEQMEGEGVENMTKREKKQKCAYKCPLPVIHHLLFHALIHEHYPTLFYKLSKVVP